ncbi:MAG: flagellar biosynthetic protein FliR [Clostridiales bacterium]|nr:flagellar biosynthetic protein FliR [Clostridiales bacterium]
MEAEVIRLHLGYFLLMFVRVSGLLISSPIFGRRNAPRAVKIGFCGIVTVVFLAALPEPEAYPSFSGPFEYGLALIRELGFGVAMGFVLTTMFNVTMTAGAIMDYQIGYSMANIYDSQNNALTPITGNLFNLMALLFFLMYDGHLKLIDIIYRTFLAVPVGAAAAPADIVWVAAEVMAKSFVLSVMAAMPVLATGFMLEVALGALIKSVPQMNMFVVGIPLKILVGLIVMLMSFGVFAGLTRDLFTLIFDYIGAMFDALSAPLAG